jgi:hypothetical protein
VETLGYDWPVYWEVFGDVVGVDVLDHEHDLLVGPFIFLFEILFKLLFGERFSKRLISFILKCLRLRMRVR